MLSKDTATLTKEGLHFLSSCQILCNYIITSYSNNGVYIGLTVTGFHCVSKSFCGGGPRATAIHEH